jgi:hypothetical protein
VPGLCRILRRTCFQDYLSSRIQSIQRARLPHIACKSARFWDGPPDRHNISHADLSEFPQAMVGTHDAGILGNVGTQDCGQPPINPIFGHVRLPTTDGAWQKLSAVASGVRFVPSCLATAVLERSSELSGAVSPRLLAGPSPPTNSFVDRTRAVLRPVRARGAVLGSPALPASMRRNGKPLQAELEPLLMYWRNWLACLRVPLLVVGEDRNPCARAFGKRLGSQR